MSIFIFIVSLVVLILVHELGHFSAAKLFGIRVDEFGLGLPPRITGKKLGETLYSINWIPFGGFVKIFGENPEEDIVDGAERKRSFQFKPKWVQAVVLAAGIFFNMLLAWVIISIGFMSGLPAPVGFMGYDSVRDAKTTIITVFPGSPAEKAGLRSGDVILFAESGGKALQSDAVSPEKVSDLIASTGQGVVTIMYKRGNEPPASAFITPIQSDGRAIIGVSMDMIGTIKLPFYSAIFDGAKTTVELIKITAVGLGSFLYSAVTFHADLSQVSGPVGIAGTFGQAGELGFSFVMSLVALLSINLALINLVPFPALDGGRLLFVLIEAVIRRPIPPRIFQWVNGVGFAILLILMFIITGHDILKLV